MEHGISESIEEQSQAKMTIKIEVEEVQLATYSDMEINLNYIKIEPGLADLMKSEPGLSMKKEAVEDGWQNIDEQHSVQAASIPAIVGSMKGELGATDIGPSVLQQVDTQGRTNQLDMSVGEQENAINNDDNDRVLYSGQKESNKAEFSDAQHSKVKSQTEQGTQSRPYGCDKCAKTYKCKGALNTHCKRAHGTGSHECTECSLKFKCKDYLVAHVRNVHSKQQHECTICKKMYKSKQALRDHVAHCHRRRPTDTQHSNEAQPEQRAQSRPYGCDKCAKTYKSRSTLYTHRKREHETGCYKCTECNLKYKCKEYLMTHVRNAHGKQQYECTMCKKTCKSKQALRNHIARYHEPTGSKPCNYICDYCQKTFTNKISITMHLTRLHTSVYYKCNYCIKCFKCEEYLKSHVATVHSADMQVCNICGKSVKTYFLRRHMRNMHSDKRLQCKLCGETMKSEQYLRQHLNDLHGQQSASSKSFQKSQTCICDYCQKTFPNKNSIRHHMNCVHTSRSYKCYQCNKSFTCEQYLKLHTAKVHIAGMQVCNVCGKSMKVYNLWQHMRTVHSDKQLQCKICGETMKSKQYLRQHLNDLHGQQSAGSHQQSTSLNIGKGLKSKGNCPRHEDSGKCTRPIVGDLNPVASTSTQQHNVFIVKEESGDGELDLGPVVYQHMDCNYRPHKEETDELFLL